MASSSLRARRVLVDSSAFLALRDQDDEHYQAASAILEQLIDGHYHLFTTNTVIIEAHALILSTLGIARAAEFLRDAQGTSLTIIRTRACARAGSDSVPSAVTSFPPQPLLRHARGYGTGPSSQLRLVVSC